MAFLTRWYPGDRAFEFMLVVSVGIVILSSAGWIIARCLPRRPAARHLVLLAALIASVLLPALGSVCAVIGFEMLSIPIGTAPTFHRLAADSQVQPDRREATSRAPEPAPDRVSPAHAPAVYETAASSIRPVRLPVLNAAAVPAHAAPTVSGAARASQPDDSMRAIFTLAFLTWAFGVLLAVARLGFGLARVVRLSGSSDRARDPSLERLLDTTSRQLRLRKNPELLVSRRAIAPTAVGFGRAAIILPERLLKDASEDELRDVLVHEAAHIKRLDHLVLLLQELGGAMYWPIVFVHALNHELERAREKLCDNAVLEFRDAVSYGETLLHIAELLLNTRPTFASAGILHSRGELETRVVRLLDTRRSKKTRAGRGLTGVTMSLFIAGTTIAAATRFVPARTIALAAATAKTRVERSNTQSVLIPDLNDPMQAGHFAGRVIGPDGKPVAHAGVFIASANRTVEAVRPVRAETDADGRFTFDAADMTYIELDGLPARRRGLIVATADGYAPDWLGIPGQRRESFHSHWEPFEAADLTLRLVRGDVPIHGRFVDQDGDALAGLRVLVTRVMVPWQHDLDAHLAREAKLEVVGMTDYARQLDRPRMLPGVATEMLTDVDGRFTLTGLGRDRLAELTVSGPQVADTRLTVMTRDAPDIAVRPDELGRPQEVIHGAAFTVQLKPGQSVSGVVRDRDTYQPIAGMRVGFPSAAVNVETDGNGRFTLTGLGAGSEGKEIIAFPAPGRLHFMATAIIRDRANTVIECARGIPFRLKLNDENGRAIEAEVSYYLIHPNPHYPEIQNYAAFRPIDAAAKRADGTYEGFVLPGPGAVVVKTTGGFDYRPAHVNPKAFFAPGNTNWTAQEEITAYGTHDTLSTYAGWWMDQHEYAAIVLVNPPAGSKPLELSATVAHDKPRPVSIVDPDGKPVVGATTQGLTFHPQDTEPRLRSASFLLTKLHPDRVQRITFFEEKRALVGFLMVRGDGDVPYVVRMQPWATVAGRLVDAIGRPFADNDSTAKDQGSAASIGMGDSGIVINGDPTVGIHPDLSTDAAGRFRVDRLVPGQCYTAKVYRGIGFFAGNAFENLVLGPGEVRDLGDIRAKPPVDVRGK
jgi:beta-lactamase regulating signal transducer with metallopeptidase domain